MSIEKATKKDDVKIGGILKSPRRTVKAVESAPPAKAKTPSQYERAHERLALDDVLKAARTYFAGIPAPIGGAKPGIEEFFMERGYSIKIAFKDTTDAIDLRQKKAMDPSKADPPKWDDPLVTEPPKEDRSIYGLFVINDDEIPVRGIVIDAVDDFKVLVRPLPDPVREENALKFCLGNLGDYDVYPAVDGTRVSLYYVARFGTWLMSTMRSFDARDYKWIGPKTYMNAFMECAPAGFTLDSLNKGAFYSFIFRHHDFHPLLADPQGMWQIQGPPTIVRQYTPIAPADVLDGDRMRFNARTSLNAFAKSRTLNYGYIFRRRVPEGAGEDPRGLGPLAVYLESLLHEFIMKQMYDIPKNITNLTHETRATYLHLRGYMALGSHHAHLMMFPQAEDVYNKMDFIIDLLSDITVAEMRAARMSDASTKDGPSPTYVREGEQARIGAQLFGDAWVKARDFIVQIGKCVGARLVSLGTMGAFGDHIHANVRDQYLSINNMPDFLKILTMH